MADLLATYPPAQGDVNAVSLVVDSTSNYFFTTTEVTAGLTPTPYAGKLAKAPGTSDPILWTRGSLYNLGLMTSLPSKGAFAEPVGFDGTYWDAPIAWGNSGTLPRLPNVLVLNGSINFTDQIAANWAYFARKRISVYQANEFENRVSKCSMLWRCVPMASASFSFYSTGVTDENLGPLTVPIPSVVPGNTSLFRAGKVFVASYQTYAMRGHVYNWFWANLSDPVTIPVDIAGTTKFVRHNSSPGNNADFSNQVLYVYSDKILADLDAVDTIVRAKFAGFKHVSYFQAADPSQTYAYLPIANDAINGPNKWWIEAAAAVDPYFSGPWLSKKMILNPASDPDVDWAAIFADVVAFFGN